MRLRNFYGQWERPHRDYTTVSERPEEETRRLVYPGGWPLWKRLGWTVAAVAVSAALLVAGIARAMGRCL